MAALWYRSGNLTLTQGSHEVSGAETAFIANVRAGDMLIAPTSDLYEVTAVVTDTSLTIDREYEGAPYTGTAWAIAPTSANLKALAKQVADLVALYQEIPADAEVAQTAANAAAASAANAKTAEANAKASETAAKGSQTAAATSATNANTYRGNALTYSNNAKTSETNAKTSETNAKASETAAKTSETNAAASAAAAGVSASALDNLTSVVAGVQTVANAAIPMAQKGANGGVASLGSNGRLPQDQDATAVLLPTGTHNLDDYRTGGLFAQNATAGAVAGGASYPAPYAGLLRVWAAEGVSANNLLWQEYTVYGMEGGSPVGFGGRRYWRSCANKTSGAWGPWREVCRTSDAMTKTVLTASADMNTLTADNTWWVWTTGTIMSGGSNFPPAPVASSGILVTQVITASYVVQTCMVTPSSGRRPIEYRRIGNGGTTWSGWRVITPVQLVSDLPTADCGDVYVDGEGWYGWNGTAYRLTFAGKNHGQCRFEYVASTLCRLLPHNGDGLIINGRQYRIPTAGVNATNSGLAANTLYYAYARDNGSGTIVVEFQTAASAPHSQHTDGVEIKTGDPTRTLVGMVRTNASSQFTNSTTYRYVASWFNREPYPMLEGPQNSATAATSYAQLTTGTAAVVWGGDLITLNSTGVVWPDTTNRAAYSVIAVNGVGIAGGYGYSLTTTGQVATAISAVHISASDAHLTFAPYGQTGGAGSVTFKQDFNGVVLQ